MYKFATDVSKTMLNYIDTISNFYLQIFFYQRTFISIACKDSFLESCPFFFLSLIFLPTLLSLPLSASSFFLSSVPPLSLSFLPSLNLSFLIFFNHSIA